MKRMGLIFRSKANKALDRAEDPRETLDYSYTKQRELLVKVRRGVADVATSRKRVELQRTQLEQQGDKLHGQAQKALAAGREDLAREALTRRSALQQQIADLQTQESSLQAEEEKLTLASQRLQAKVEAFRTKKETIKATYTAAEAQTKIGEAFSGISEEMSDVGLAVERAEDKTAQMQARAGAVDELLASGALEDVTASPEQRHRARARRDLRPDPTSTASWRALKAELGTGERQAIEGGTGTETGDGRAGQPARRAARGRPRGHRMIIRIMGEGQFELPDDEVDTLNALDEQVERAVESHDDNAFAAAFAQLLERVRTHGAALADDALVDSDLVLPPSDSTVDDVARLLGDEGLIPG